MYIPEVKSLEYTRDKSWDSDTPQTDSVIYHAVGLLFNKPTHPQSESSMVIMNGLCQPSISMLIYSAFFCSSSLLMLIDSLALEEEEGRRSSLRSAVFWT